MRYPSVDDEVEVIARMDAGLYEGTTAPPRSSTLADIRRVQAVVRSVHMDRALIEYASRLVGVTRDPERASAREPGPAHRVRRQPPCHHRVVPHRESAGRTARARPRGARRYRALAHRVLRHRLILGFEAASARVTPDVVVDAVLQAVRVP